MVGGGRGGSREVELRGRGCGREGEPPPGRGWGGVLPYGRGAVAKKIKSVPSEFTRKLGTFLSSLFSLFFSRVRESLLGVILILQSFGS